MTEYIVLQGVGDGWEEVGRYEARSDLSAIRQRLADAVDPAANQHVYVAVPKRSFRERRPLVKTTTQIKFQ
jgi:hypothetical protein